MLKDIFRQALKKFGYSIARLPRASQEESENIFQKGKVIIEKISPEFKVLNGPFKNLQYPSIDITESTLVPKLVGSYEAQLNQILESVFREPYIDIIDIGSAEGYYAIGFAMRMPHATVHCFDINDKDLAFCKAMANKNGVTNLTYNNLCTPSTLINFPFKGRGFILCDCEGYELELFTEDVVANLKSVDLLVELHDVNNPVISGEILSRFQRTHHFAIINNLNVDRSKLQGLEKLSDEEKEFAVYEHRGGIYKNIYMEWALLTSKQNN